MILARQALFSLLAVTIVSAATPDSPAVDTGTMQRIYDEAKTPFKYGVVLPAPPGKKVDCPNVFRHGDKWFMAYVQLENDPQGYTTQLAESGDLLHWTPRGTILQRGATNAWDFANAAAGVALFDTTWAGRNSLQTHDGRYWLSYLGGPNPGYEIIPLSISLASTDDPSVPKPWRKLPAPVLKPSDADARGFERETLFKSYVFRDEARSLGAPFVMFYNARPPKDSERIGVAVSQDLKTWKRYGDGPVLANERPPGLKHGVISGDPQIVRMHDVWVMFYFGAFWKPGAFDTFAASRDLTNWTKWSGPDLVAMSEPWDKEFAHKPWLLKHDGVVYHYYCAVGDQGRVIALATSKDFRAKPTADSTPYASPAESSTGGIAPKPLFRDPIHDGAADTVVVWNPHVKRWWLFYTNRRANLANASGVSWVHGTRIGIAESADEGGTWKYLGTADIELPPEFGGDQTTHWAPEVMTAPDGTHHMFLSVVPGIFENWDHPRSIVHLTSADLRHWTNAVPLKLASDRVIDACIFQLAGGTWRLWYNNERDRKSIYYADSPDLVNWTDKGKAVGDQAGEGPKVFRWHDAYWLVTDVWRGLAVYRSDDALDWSRQPGQILETPGTGADDGVIGGHPDVVVNGGRAFLFYFTHPGRRGPDARKDGYEQRRSSIQVVELKFQGGKIACDRDEPTRIQLVPPADAKQSNEAAAATFPVHIRVDASKPLGELKPVWRFFGADEPNYAYMKNGRKLLGELGALQPDRVYFRAHNLLSSGDGTPALKWGSSGAYREDEQSRPVYDWTILDRIFDAYRESGVRPYAQIGFMPKDLSIKPEPYQHTWTPAAKYDEIYTGWAYPPKDYAKWAALVEAWVKHCVERYGRTEVEQWYWEVWNEPNIGYWRGTREEFFKLHDYAIDAVRRALPTARVGGPDVAGSGGKFSESFFQHCLRGTNFATGQVGTPLDFVAFHAKGAPVYTNDHVRMGIAMHLRTVNDGFRIIAGFPELKTKPIVIGESDPEGCAACQGPQLGYRNGTMYSSYTAASFARIYDLAERHGVNLEGVLTWAFTFEDQPLFAGFRQLATGGIDLPVLNVFRMFRQMGGQRLAAQSDAAVSLDDMMKTGVRERPDVSVVASRDGNRLCVLLWHYHDDDVAGLAAEVSLRISGLSPGSRNARITQYRIDEEHSNAYTAWKAMNSPTSPTAEQMKTIESAGRLALGEPVGQLSVESGNLTLRTGLRRQAVCLIVLDL